MLISTFMQVLDQTRTASFVIMLVLLARVPLRRTPKVFSYALWVIVLVRLLCPVSLQSPVSLMPQMESVSQQYTLTETPIAPTDAGAAAMEAVGDALNGGLGLQHIQTMVPDGYGGMEQATSLWWEVWVLVGQYLWLAGIAMMSLYVGFTYGKLRRKLCTASPLRDNIWLSDEISSPFVLGLISPKIYLPSALPEREQKYIICHEQHHIRRLDHIWKALGFLSLTIHWFNPLVWLAYQLAVRDMEMSCDEAVVKQMGEGIRADYTASLLSLATGHQVIAGIPLAFGEGSPGERIRNLARWKKPTVCGIALAMVLAAVMGIGLLTDPPSAPQSVCAQNYTVSKLLYAEGDFATRYPMWKNCAYSIDSHFFLASTTKTGIEGGPSNLGILTELELTEESFDRWFLDDGWALGKSAASIRENNAHAWKLLLRQWHLYYVLQQKNGDIYLAYGNADETRPEEDRIVFLFQLSAQSGHAPEEQWTMSMSVTNLSPEDAAYSEQMYVISEGTSALRFHVSSSSPYSHLEIGLKGADGQVFSKNLRHGYGKGTIPDIPAGTYRLFLKHADPAEAQTVAVCSVAAELPGAAMVAAPLLNTPYVPWRCVYMSPLSSYFAVGGDSGCQYIFGEDHFTVVNRGFPALAEDGSLVRNSTHRTDVARWEWKPFPYEQDVWNSFFLFPDLHEELLLSKETLYLPITQEDFLMQTQGELLLVKLYRDSKTGPHLGYIYSLVPESIMGSARWEFTPHLSVGSPMFHLKLGMPHTGFSAFTNDGELWDEDHQNGGAHLELEANEPLYWSPLDKEGNVVPNGKIRVSISGKENSAATLYFTSVTGEYGWPIYTFTLVGTGLHLSQTQNGAVLEYANP